MITQLYEISSLEEVQLCIDAGVDHVGVLVGEGQFPRELRLDEAAQLLATLPKGVLGSALSALFSRIFFTLVRRLKP